MCGILISIHCPLDHDLDHGRNHLENFEQMWQNLVEKNSARGPDGTGILKKRFKTESNNEIELRFFSSELQLRGHGNVVQPHTNNKDVFCWNGEVFEGLNVDFMENDGVKIFHRLRELEYPNLIAKFLGETESPFAFTYFQASSHKLFFGRDILGRRSLLIHKPTAQCPYFLLASVAAGSSLIYSFEEVPSNYLYCIDIAQISSPDDFKKHSCTINKYSMTDNPIYAATPVLVNRAFNDMPPLIHTLDCIPPELTKVVDDFISHLSRSVYYRVRDIPQPRMQGQARLAVLFSGGIDSSMLAYLADRYIPREEPIDLLNVAFENPRKRQTTGPSNKQKKKHSKLALNDEVAAEKAYDYLVPDRVTGLAELIELKRICPHRNWKFVEINVDFNTSAKHRSVVADLMYPGQTVMDMSLGLALYFASKGAGILRDTNGKELMYNSPARVLLNGLGSDELLGGYGRHRTVYNLGGWPAVIDELQSEVNRIPTRNLGRDDRIISSHGKEARYPFLSLSVVTYISKLPINYKMDPRLDLGVGDKMLLRLAAHKEGLIEASIRKKRAMQFGSHSARMEAGDKESRGDLSYSQ